MYKKLTLTEVGCELAEFYSFELFPLWVLKESCFKTTKVLLNKLFLPKMFIFANFLQTIDLEQSNSQRLGMTLPEFCLFESHALPKLGESWFKAPNIFLDEHFCHLNIHFRKYFTKSWVWAIRVSGGGRGTCWIFLIWVESIPVIRGKFFKSSAAQIFSPFKYSFLLVLYKKSTLSDHIFWG